MTYTASKVQGQELAYSIATTYNGEDISFTVVCASDESELPDLVAYHLAYLDAPESVYTPSSDYLAFWDALMVSTVYASIREQSFVSLPMNTLATEFIALIGDAKAGRANEVAIQASISAILSVGTFSEEQLLELGDALAQGNLNSIYSIA
jgi:hypothetical protein